MNRRLAGLGAVIVVGVCAFGVGYRTAEGTARNHVRHLMLFTLGGRVIRGNAFVPGLNAPPPERAQTIEDAFSALPSKIPAIECFEWGPNVGRLPDASRCSHCYLLTFRDAKAHEEFLSHPAYEEVRKMLEPFTRGSPLIEVAYVVQE
jgi:hypothetical protein